MSQIKLLVGLGNPGADYAATRHNAGAWLVEALAADLGVNLSPSKFFGLHANANLAGSKLHLFFPTKFMNLSGQSVAALANFYKIQPEEILIVHDELDLPAGQVRLKKGGGTGGHNGLKSCISSLGNNQNFYRLRLGIGHPGEAKLVTSYVLKRPLAAEKEAIDSAITASLHQLPNILNPSKQATAMNELHSLK